LWPDRPIKLGGVQLFHFRPGGDPQTPVFRGLWRDSASWSNKFARICSLKRLFYWEKQGHFGERSQTCRYTCSENLGVCNFFMSRSQDPQNNRPQAACGTILEICRPKTQPPEQNRPQTGRLLDQSHGSASNLSKTSCRSRHP